MKARYYIYRNLHTGGFSIKHHGRVIDRGNFLVAEGVTFKVNELGRQRVIREKRKNVHAYTVCDKYKDAGFTVLLDNLPVITYNPYVAGEFTCNGKTIEKANAVLFKDGRCYLID